MSFPGWRGATGNIQEGGGVGGGNDKIKHDVVYLETGLIMLHDIMSCHITSNQVTVMWASLFTAPQCRVAVMKN